MNTHKNARLTVHSRQVLVRRVVEDGHRPIDVAQAMAVSPRTVYKWLARYRREGWRGLTDRSCRPHRCPHRQAQAQRARIIRLRRQRRIYRAIQRTTGEPVSTIARVLQAAGLNRLSRLEPAPPARRYEHAAPGDLLHLDIKSSIASPVPAIASRAIVGASPRARAGTMSTWPSTITAASPMPRSGPMKPAPVQYAR